MYVDAVVTGDFGRHLVTIASVSRAQNRVGFFALSSALFLQAASLTLSQNTSLSRPVSV